MRAKTTRRLCCVSVKSALFQWAETKPCKNTAIFMEFYLFTTLQGLQAGLFFHGPLHLGVVSAALLLWLCISHRKLVHGGASSSVLTSSTPHCVRRVSNSVAKTSSTSSTARRTRRWRKFQEEENYRRDWLL